MSVINTLYKKDIYFHNGREKMINPIAARIAFRTTSPATTTPVAPAANRLLSNADSFTSSETSNKNNTEVKSNKTLLEILFGSVSKKKKNNATRIFNASYEAKLYAKPKNEAELREFIDSYEPIIKF